MTIPKNYKDKMMEAIEHCSTELKELGCETMIILAEHPGQKGCCQCAEGVAGNQLALVVGYLIETARGIADKSGDSIPALFVAKKMTTDIQKLALHELIDEDGDDEDEDEDDKEEKPIEIFSAKFKKDSEEGEAVKKLLKILAKKVDGKD